MRKDILGRESGMCGDVGVWNCVTYWENIYILGVKREDGNSMVIIGLVRLRNSLYIILSS